MPNNIVQIIIALGILAVGIFIGWIFSKPKRKPLTFQNMISRCLYSRRDIDNYIENQYGLSSDQLKDLKSHVLDNPFSLYFKDEFGNLREIDLAQIESDSGKLVFYSIHPNNYTKRGKFIENKN